MSILIGFESQPDFPIEDISQNNAAMADIYLDSAVEPEVYSALYRTKLQMLHDIGNAALMGADISPGNNRGEYMAFCDGFGTVDYLARLLDSRPYRQLEGGSSMKRLFLDQGEMVELAVWERREMWLDTHPNVAEIMRKQADTKEETNKEFAARLIGAQIASEIFY